MCWTQIRFWTIHDRKVHEANMGHTWGRQDPGGPHVGPMNLAIWDTLLVRVRWNCLWGVFGIKWPCYKWVRLYRQVLWNVCCRLYIGLVFVPLASRVARSPISFNVEWKLAVSMAALLWPTSRSLGAQPCTSTATLSPLEWRKSMRKQTA